MLNHIARLVLRNIAAVAITAAVWLGAPFLVEDGRLTDVACYLLLALVALVTAWVWSIDRRVRRGSLDEADLPMWLRS